MDDGYFDWFRTEPGGSDPFPVLDAGQRAALDELTASRPARAYSVRATEPSSRGSPKAPASEYLLDVTVAMTAFESFADMHSGAGVGDLLVGDFGPEADVAASIPDYGGDIHRVENIGSNMYMNEGGAFFDGDPGVSVIPGEGVSY
jgi:hypothetical protein